MNNELKFESYWELYLEMNTYSKWTSNYLANSWNYSTWSVLWKLSNEKKTSRWMKNHKNRMKLLSFVYLGLKIHATKNNNEFVMRAVF